jgi:uncharacterized caspase-like protein
MNKLLSIVVVSLFSVYLLSACSGPPKQPDNKPPGQPEFVPDPMQQALVIGNAQYPRKALTNPANDATDMADALKKQGFTVALHTDLNRIQMESAIRDFKKRLFAHQGSVGLFYFSGHGAQLDNKSYLIPVNNDEIKTERDVEWEAVSVDKILAQMQGRNNGLQIIILDACRNNPYPSYVIKGGGKDGLADFTPPKGVIIGYATGPGEVALDLSEGRNSLYTKHLLKAIKPNERIDDILMQVRGAVLNDAVVRRSRKKQTPWYKASMTKPFRFGERSQ